MAAPPLLLADVVRPFRGMLPDAGADRTGGAQTMPYVLAALGGVLGALARWGVGTALPVSPGSWPWATLLVNLTGCFLLGVLVAVVGARLPEPSWVRPFLAVGVLGGYTTFSAFAVEVVALVEAGAVLTAAGYCLVSVLGGVVAVALGVVGGRALVGGVQ